MDEPIVVRVVSEVAAPPEAVFAVIEDLERFVELEEGTLGVAYTSPQRRGLGVRTRWRFRDPGTGEEWESEEEIVEYDPPRRYAYVGRSGEREYGGVHVLTALPDGATRHEFTETFSFDADPAAYDDAVRKMIGNVRTEAEARGPHRRGSPAPERPRPEG